MKRLLRNGLLVCTIIILFTTTSCNNNAEDISKTNNLTVGLCMHFMKDDYSRYFVNAFSEAMNDSGITYFITDGMGDPKKQIADVESLVSRGVDIIGICPMDEKIIKNSLNEAIEHGIAVLSITNIPGVEVVSKISGGDYENGRGIGEYMLEELEGQGEVIVTDFPYEIDRINERIRGFEDAISGSNIKIVAKINPSTNEETMESIKILLEENPDISGIFACYSNQLLASGAVLKALDRNDLVVVGIDADISIINMILEGWITASAAQFPKEHGKLAAEEMIKYLNGETHNLTIEVPYKIVDKSNAEEMAIELWDINLN